MPKVKATSSSKETRKMRPALTPDAREKQLISLAVDLAEQQLRDGTASSQVITHYLKLGSSKERLEMERLAEENKLLKAKTEQIKSMESSEQRYKEALKAMMKYQGHASEEDELDDY